MTIIIPHSRQSLLPAVVLGRQASAAIAHQLAAARTGAVHSYHDKNFEFGVYPSRAWSEVVPSYLNKNFKFGLYYLKVLTYNITFIKSIQRVRQHKCWVLVMVCIGQAIHTNPFTLYLVCIACLYCVCIQLQNPVLCLTLLVLKTSI